MVFYFAMRTILNSLMLIALFALVVSGQEKSKDKKFVFTMDSKEFSVIFPDTPYTRHSNFRETPDRSSDWGILNTKGRDEKGVFLEAFIVPITKSEMGQLENFADDELMRPTKRYFIQGNYNDVVISVESGPLGRFVQASGTKSPKKNTNYGKSLTIRRFYYGKKQMITLTATMLFDTQPNSIVDDFFNSLSVKIIPPKKSRP